ncbi:MAG: ABC transporter permease [Candidatus Thorarchaeota archaeon]|nr:MAG: ABC transporter permease [Candidatus Thorarchaeota archaeon]
MGNQSGTKTVWLLKKEIKSVLRSKWLILGFMISPLFAWLFQGAFLNFVFAQAIEPENVYITVEDEGAWGAYLNNSFWAQYNYEKDNPNVSFLLIEELIPVDRSMGEALWENRTAPVWILIPANFTEVLEATNESMIILYVNSGSFRAQAAGARIDFFARWVIDEVIELRKLEVSRIEPVTPEASYGHQLAIFLVMLTSVLAPGPYVSKSFAGERERHTLEALLVVPLSRLRILGAKLVAGLILTMIYSAFTIVGILVYNFLVVFRAQGAIGGDEAVQFYSINVETLPLIFFCQFLILLCAIGIGVVISMLAKDQASAESINNLILLVPTMVIGILGFTGSILQYGGLFGMIVWLIPFSHAIMFLNGVLSGAATVTSLTVNVLYMLGFTLVFLVLGARAFEREAIIA